MSRAAAWAFIVLRVVVGWFALRHWYCVVFNRRILWKGSRAPLSQTSKIVMAIAWTAWSLAASAIYPLFCGAVFALCILCAFPLGWRDKRAYEVYHGWPQLPGLTKKQRWLVLCLYDGFLLSILLFVFIRDIFLPPSSKEQLFAHNMGILMLAIAAVGAIALYVTRPGKIRKLE